MYLARFAALLLLLLFLTTSSNISRFSPDYYGGSLAVIVTIYAVTFLLIKVSGPSGLRPLLTGYHFFPVFLSPDTNIMIL